MITSGSLCNMDADCECGCDGYDDVDDDDDQKVFTDVKYIKYKMKPNIVYISI